MANKKEYDDAFDEVESSSPKAQQINEYYDLAKKQNYTKLLDSEIQLENSKSAALKYTQNQLNAQGFGTQGYGSSVQSGVYGQYANAFSELEQNAANENADLDKARISELSAVEQQENEENFQSTIQLINDSNDMGRLDQLLAGYGYGTIDESGNFVWGEKPEGMSQRDWAEIQYRYNLQADSIAEQNQNNYYTYYDIDDLNYAQYQSKSGAVNNVGDHFKEEVKDAFSYADQGKFSEGAVIRVRNGEGDTIYLQWTGDGFSMVSRGEYEKAESKWTCSRDGKAKKNIWNQVS